MLQDCFENIKFLEIMIDWLIEGTSWKFGKQGFMPAALTKNCFMTVLSSAFIIIFGKQLLHSAENLPIPQCSCQAGNLRCMNN